MEEALKFEVIDNNDQDTKVELMVDIEDDVFVISIAGEKIMPDDWSRNLQIVFERALSLWKEKESET